MAHVYGAWHQHGCDYSDVCVEYHTSSEINRMVDSCPHKEGCITHRIHIDDSFYDEFLDWGLWQRGAAFGLSDCCDNSVDSWSDLDGHWPVCKTLSLSVNGKIAVGISCPLNLPETSNINKPMNII